MRSKSLLMFTISVLLLSATFLSGEVSGQEQELLLELDLEEDDGGLVHGGTFDEWEWGKPGTGSLSNPGPVSTPDGERCFGSPLNGTYEEGTLSYLGLDDVSVGPYYKLTLEYLIWYDLSLLEDEENGTGEGRETDHLVVQILDEEGIWQTVRNYSGSTSGIWYNELVDISFFNGEDLSLRFVLVDVEDGMEDNGVFIDSIRLLGELRPLEDIDLTRDPLIYARVPLNEISRVHYWVQNNGRNIPPETYVSLSVTGPDGFQAVDEQAKLSSQRRYGSYFEWTPLFSGTYEVFLNLTVDGNLRSTTRKLVVCQDHVFYEDFEASNDTWSTDTIRGNGTWKLLQISDTSSSGGNAAIYGSGPSGSSTSYFRGDSYSIFTGPWIDLSDTDEAYLYMSHAFGFLGETGSCGGSVQVKPGGGDWSTLEPDLPHTRRLGIGISGPMEGEYAFQGERDWYQIGFDLSGYAGTEIVIRFVVSSGPDGEGTGWSIDDVLITGEGLDPNDRDPPLPIEGLSVFPVADGEVEIGWTSSFAPDLAYYNIYLGTGDDADISGMDPYKAVEKENDTYILITGLSPEVEYWVAVTAVDRTGNEDTTIYPEYFTAVEGSTNRPPLAVIRVIGGTSGNIGDIFILNATSSSDPDGDDLKYTWKLPDGTVRQGPEIRWRSDISGNSLVINLVVQDQFGNRDSANVTLSIGGQEADPTENEDIKAFLICMSPFVVFILLAVFLVSWLKGSKGRKLKKELLMEGIETRPTGQKVNAEVIEEPQTSKKEVMDLTPVLTTRSHGKEKRSTPEMDRPKKTAAPLPGGEKETGPGRDMHLGSIETVSALVECPFCGNAFKARVEKKKLMSGEPFEVKCTHCGRAGEIG